MKIKIEEVDSKKDMKVIGTYVNLDIYQQLKAEADNKFMSISSLVKMIIYNYLKSNKLN